MTLVIDLPIPPSTNNLFRNTKSGRRVKSNAYEDWLNVCFALCLQSRWHKTPVRGSFVATITVDATSRRKGADIDNRGKAVLDALQNMGVIENDCLCDRVTIQWGEAPEGCRVEIEPSTASAPFLMPVEG